ARARASGGLGGARAPGAHGAPPRPARRVEGLARRALLGAGALLELLEDIGEHGADELVVLAPVAEARDEEALPRALEDLADDVAVVRRVDLDERVLDRRD